MCPVRRRAAAPPRPSTTALWVLLILLAGCDPGCTQPDDDDDAGDDDTTGDDDTAGDDDSADDDTADDDTGPDDPLDWLEPCAGGVLAAFEADAMDPPAPFSDEYATPSAHTRAGVLASMSALLAGDGAAAVESIDGTGYSICRGVGDEQPLVRWAPLVAGDGGARVAWRSGPARPLIVGAPHAHHEVGTLDQAVTAFDRLDARALVVSGTHRCANLAESPCEGSSPVCTGDEEDRFRDSDMAHVVASVFQAAHEALVGRYPDDWIVNLHGMEYAGISVSDGTDYDTALGSPVARLAEALAAAFPSQRVTTCNAWPGGGVEVDPRLCGTFNVQGRLINGAQDPCADGAAHATDRFLHVEQSVTVREYPDLVLGALDGVVPAPR